MIERLARRPAAGFERDPFLRLAAGHELDELPSELGITREAADAQLPTAQGGGAPLPGKAGNGTMPTLPATFDCLGSLGDFPGVGPIAMEDRFSLRKQGQRFWFLVGQNAAICD